MTTRSHVMGGEVAEAGRLLVLQQEKVAHKVRVGLAKVEEVCENSCSKNFYSAHFLITCWCR